jgi:alkylation response protein AidB-like acyl-CoA dehydrogenase
MRRTVYNENHDAFRQVVRQFLEDEVRPEYESWESTSRPSRRFWSRAGELGLLGVGVPGEYGGLAGSTFKHSAVVTEEVQRAGFALGGLRVQTDICMPYLLEYASGEQRARWLPEVTSGAAVLALALSEPGAGSDMKAMSTRARRDGDHYVINGAKTFISNGLGADLVILAAKTDPEAGRRGMSLFVVEATSEGFARGPSLRKIGLKTQDLSELFFTDLVVPATDLLGEENHGFEYLTSNLAQERLSIAVNSQAAAASALGHTVQRFVAADGESSQHTKFELAACAAEVQAGQAMIDCALDAHDAGELTASDAASLKLFCTELQGRVTDRCLELFGPSGYERTSLIGRLYADGRVSRIYGGSSEIMKVIIAKDLGL